MIGISSTEFSAYQFEEVLEEVAKEFEHWEIFAEAEHYLKSIVSRFRMVAPSYNLSYSVHAPISDINIGSLNERIREDSTMEIITTMDFAAEMGINMITIHPGMSPMAVPYMEERAMEQTKKSLRTIDRVSADYGITIALENMPSFPFMLGQTVDEMKQLMDGTNLSMCFDIGHANTTSQIPQMLSEFRDRVVNIHIHDNNGVSDEHLTCGEGNIDFKTIIGDMKRYCGNYIIESRSFPSGVESQEYLKKLF